MSIRKVDTYTENPDLLVRDLNKALEDHIDSIAEKKAGDWRKRNDGLVVSGSQFSQCSRKAWYSYFTPPAEANFNTKAKKRMHGGYINEDLWIESMIAFGFTVHYDESKPPVNQKISRDGVTLSTTGDNVLEFTKGKSTILIPIEEKSTDVSDWKRGGDWWPKFEGYDYHRRQLVQFMYYARENKYNVPLGILRYTRRNGLDSKYVVITDGNIPFSPVGSNEIYYENYSEWESIVEGRVSVLVEGIKTKTLPPLGS